MSAQRPRWQSWLLTLRRYVTFFLTMAFVISCCMLLFASQLQATLGVEFTREQISRAAQLTFGNVDGSLIRHDSENIVVWDRAELAPRAEPFELSIRFRVITEYVAPNYENVYPEEITEYLDPISWQAHFGKTYSITLTGDRTNGYQAVLNQ